MKQLIVNADDMGRTPEINAGIVEAFVDGIVTGATIMTNFPAFEDAVDLVKTHHLPIGVHLNLTEGKPLCDPSAVPSLVDAEGYFLGKVQFFLHAKRGQISVTEARRELTAQVQKALDHGLPVDHLDGHHHVHSERQLSAVCCDIARAAGIRAMRWISRPKFFFPLRAALQQWTTHAVIARRSRPTLAHPDHFWGFELWRANDKEQALLDVLHRLRPGVNELMGHPGHVSAESVGKANKARADELAALCSKRAKQRIEEKGIRLIDYRELY